MSAEGADAFRERRRLEILLTIGAQIASELNLERAVQVVTDAATELTEAAFGSFFYNTADKHGDSYMLHALSGVPKDAFSQFSMPLNTKVFGPTFAGEGVVRSDDIQKDPRYGQSAPHYGQPKGHLPVHSYLAVPVTSRAGHVIGGLFFGHPDVGRFTEEHEKLAVGIAAYAAIAIDNARLYRAAESEIERRKQVEELLRNGEIALRDSNATLIAEASGLDEKTKVTLAQLHDSERNFRLLVQSVTDYAIYMLDPDGTVATWNAGAERIKGYAAREIIGGKLSQFFTQEDRDAGVPDMALKIARDAGRYESEGWRIRKDGSRFWAFAVIDAVRDEGGNLLGFAKITRDMTERREAQLQLQRAQEQMAQAQKMEAIGHLTGGIAHDFNNLLMIVSGQAQLMRLRTANPKDIRALGAIEQAAASGSNLTRQLLTFARRQRLNSETIDLDERLEAFRDLLISSVGGAVSLDIDIPDGTWKVAADVSELELALVNIAVNARDAMPDGGMLKIGARNVSLHGDPVALEGEFVALVLADTGTGIPANVQARVFEPFFTTKDVGKGTGLGLSQVYGFVRQSGGDVHIDSAEGEGTTFTLYLPRAKSEAIAPTRHQADAGAMEGKGNVLVVEDNLHVGEVSVLLLEELGYTVTSVTCPAEAINLLVQGQCFDLVFSDIVMPGDTDGLTFARALRDRYPSLPVLLATGYSSAAERVGSEFPILRKPYNYNSLAFAAKMAMSAKIRQSAEA